MQLLNAIDAVAPAFTRTHQVLFRPFRIGRSWKLAVSQYLGLIGAFFIPFPLFLAFVPLGGLNIGIARAAIFVVTSIVTLVMFAVFYLCVRMQFVNFEMIVTRAQFIAPMWRRYSARVWPVIAFKTILGTILPLAMLPLVWKTGRTLIQVFAQMPRITPDQRPDPMMFQAIFARMIGLYALIFCAFTLIKLVSSAFEDFVMPFYILENITLTEAFRRGFTILAGDPLQCLLYFILKLVLFIIGFIMQYVSTLIVVIPFAIIGVIAGIVGAGIGGATHGGGASSLVLISLGVFFYVLFLALTVWYQAGTIGYLSTLLEAYAIFFLGGRYRLLGDMLEPSTAAPFTPPPTFPSPEERDNEDDGGPPMPMDPALA